MTRKQRESAIAAIADAHQLMMRQMGRKCSRSKRARERIAANLYEFSLLDERTTLCKFCLLLSERMEEERDFDIAEDLVWVDAAKDLVEYGRPWERHINRKMQLVFR